MRKPGAKLGQRSVNSGKSRVHLGQFGGGMIQGPSGMTAQAGFGGTLNMITGPRDQKTSVQFGDFNTYWR